MKIRNRLALWFAAMAALVLVLFFSSIVWLAEQQREQDFFRMLEREALTKFNLLVVTQLDPGILQQIYRSSRQYLDEVELAVYDQYFHLLYHDAADIDVVKEDHRMLEQILQQGHVYFYQNHWQVVGLRHIHQGQTYLLTAASYDTAGYGKVAYLLRVGLVGLLVSLVLLFWAGRFFARQTLEPIRTMIERARTISAISLSLRLPAGKQRDELSELADTFNQMLDRLEQAFDTQKHLIANLSHELRTPLSAMITELELALHRQRDEQAYRQAIEQALADARRMVRLTNSLLNLAKAEYDPSQLSMKPMRMDEIILSAIQQLQQAYATYEVEFNFVCEPEDDWQVTVIGNEYLLCTAIINLMENACKFSGTNRCEVLLDFSQTQVCVWVVDQGPGIDPDDLPKLFSPFFRGRSQRQVQGSGIGLYLVRKVAQLHRGGVEVAANNPNGARFIFYLPIAKLR